MSFARIHLAHHGRHHVAVLQMEIVVGAIEVGGHHGNVVGAVRRIRGTVLLTHFHFTIYSLYSQDPSGMSEQVRVLQRVKERVTASG